MKLRHKKATADMLTILIATAIMGVVVFNVYRSLNNTYKNSNGAINTRLSSQMVQYTK